VDNRKKKSFMPYHYWICKNLNLSDFSVG
jgi:hypothetical protein